MTTADLNPYQSPQTAEMAGSPLTISPAGDMEYSYEMTEQDWVALQDNVLQTSSYFRKHHLTLRLIVALGAAVVGLFALWRDPGGLWYLATILFVVSAVFVVIPSSFWRWRNLSAARGMLREGGNRALFGPQRLRVTPLEVAKFHAYGYSAVYWPAVDRIETTPNHMFIYLGAFSAHIVPLRDLRTEHDRQTFIETVNRYLTESRGPLARGSSSPTDHSL